MSQVTIYTDGACRGNPGPGGWGVLLTAGEHEKTLCGGELETTNNRMELMAAIKAMEALHKPTQVLLVTDSKYVMQGINEWLKNWKKRNWLTAAKKPVKKVSKKVPKNVVRSGSGAPVRSGSGGYVTTTDFDSLTQEQIDELYNF